MRRGVANPSAGPSAGPALPAVLVIALALVGLLVTGCADDVDSAPPPEDPQRPTITVTSFDFPESVTLAELYGQALRSHGYPVEVVPRLGPRDIVEPALEQGRVDFVPGYLGSGLNFLSEQRRVATADSRATHALLKRALAGRGVSALSYAPAQDRNGFAVTGDTARRRGLRYISDLLPIARQLSLGGPSECPVRPLCLRGLREVYGLEFQRFVPQPSRATTADALEAGEIDVGMLETTDGNLAARDLKQLEDDRGLQPAENVVPLVRDEIIAAYGAVLVRLVDAVTAQLTTRDLVLMNSRVQLQGVEPSAAAAEWLRRHPVDAGRPQAAQERR
jgi:osmoprotectant transport system substrate-binding protein